MLPLTYFPLVLGYKEYSFLEQAAKECEHGVDSIFMDSVETQELEASFDEADVMPPLVSLRALCMVNTHSDVSRQ